MSVHWEETIIDDALLGIERATAKEEKRQLLSAYRGFAYYLFLSAAIFFLLRLRRFL